MHELGVDMATQMRRYRRVQASSRDLESVMILLHEEQRLAKESALKAAEAASQQEREARFQRGWLTMTPNADDHGSVHDGLTVAEMSQIIAEDVKTDKKEKSDTYNEPIEKHHLHALYQSSEDNSSIEGLLRSNTHSWVREDAIVNLQEQHSKVVSNTSYLSSQQQIAVTLKRDTMEGTIEDTEKGQVNAANWTGFGLDHEPLDIASLKEGSVMTSNTDKLQDSKEMGAFIPSHSIGGFKIASSTEETQGASRSLNHSKNATLPKTLPKWFGRKLGETNRYGNRARTADEGGRSAAGTFKNVSMDIGMGMGIPEKHYQPNRSVMKPTVWKYSKTDHMPLESQQSLRKGGDLFRSTLAGSMIIEGHLDDLSLAASLMKVPSLHGKAPPKMSRSTYTRSSSKI